MADAWKNYTDLVADQTGFLGCWTPSGELALGDIVVLDEKRAPIRQRNISDLGIDLAPKVGERHRTYGASSGAEIEVAAGLGSKAPVHVGVKAGAELEVTFKRANAVLMRSEDCRIDQFDRLDRLKREIGDRHAAGKWEREWLVINQVVTAERLLVLISELGGASVRVGISGEIGADVVSLAKGHGQVRLLHGSTDVWSETSEEPTTPLYRALVVRKRWTGKEKVAQADKRGHARPESEEFDVVEFRY